MSIGIIFSHDEVSGLLKGTSHQQHWQVLLIARSSPVGYYTSPAIKEHTQHKGPGVGHFCSLRHLIMTMQVLLAEPAWSTETKLLKFWGIRVLSHV